jgi:hypothetical protein
MRAEILHIILLQTRLINPDSVIYSIVVPSLIAFAEPLPPLTPSACYPILSITATSEPPACVPTSLQRDGYSLARLLVPEEEYAKDPDSYYRALNVNEGCLHSINAGKK